MSDTPTPPEDAPRRASGETSVPPPLVPEAAAPAPRPRRFDWRPKVRWFAAEIVVVVAGVLIALALNAWWGARQDAAREQEYLRQLVEDLKETERDFERSEASQASRDAAATKLVRAFRSSSPPPADSVVLWSVLASWISIPSMVTGAADALVETGDLNLIRDDSLRSSITHYLNLVDRQLVYLERISEDANPHIWTLSGRVDYAHARILRRSPAELDAARRANPMFPIPEAPQQAFEPLDVEALIRDREAYTAIWNLWRLRNAGVVNRRRALEATVALREQVEAELDR